MSDQVGDGQQGRVELRAGVIYLRWNRGVSVTERTVRDVMTEVSSLCSGRRRPLLVDSQWMEALGPGARDVFAVGWPVTRVAVVGTSPVDQVMFVFYVARHRPVCPTRFFTSVADAVTWLTSRASAAVTAPAPGGGGSRG